MPKSKKPDMSNLFAKTAPAAADQDNSDLDRGNIRASGVGLTQGEREALDAIGAELGQRTPAHTPVSRNALLRFAARRLILDYRAGRLNLDSMVKTPEPKPSQLEMPST